jgi:protein-arginine kinase activator protein McsA
MSGIEPVTMPNPPEVTKTCMWLLCEGDVGCARCCAMSAALVPDHAIRGVAGVHTGRVSEQMHPAHALTSTINPLKQTKI